VLERHLRSTEFLRRLQSMQAQPTSAIDDLESNT